MVRRQTRPARRVWSSKQELLAAGQAVVALTYQRASQDKKEEGASVETQEKLNLGVVDSNRWRLGRSFTDNDKSASRHAKKTRPDFDELVETIRSGVGDVLVVYEISRRERDLAVFVKIRDLCHAEGLFYWCVRGVLYDIRDLNDRMMLGFQAVQAEWMADYIRDNVLRGMTNSAEKGRPHGKVTYGYRRIYDQRTKALLRQEFDDEVREAVAADGVVSTYTQVGIVREIFDRVAAGDPLITIERDLNDRGVPSPEKSETGWLRGIIRKIAMNPAYIGKRVFRGKVVGDGIWDAAVDEETYWACRRLLEDPSRKTTRPARAIYLLSYIAKCGECGGPLSAGWVRRHGWEGLTYRCLKRQCCAVKMEYLDEYIERIVVTWLTTADVHEALHRRSTDRDTSHARAEAQRLRAQLEDYKKLAEAGDIEPIDYARFSRGLKAGIAEAEARAQETSIPPVLRGRIGRHAAREWAKLADNVAVRRDIIREILSIELLRTDGDNRKFGPHRVRLAWTYGESTPTATPGTAATNGRRRRSDAAPRPAAETAPAQRRPVGTANPAAGPGTRAR